MKKIQIKTKTKSFLADIVTPISIFLRIREIFPYSVILESADYHAKNNGFSYIACDPVATFKLDQDYVEQQWPDKITEKFKLSCSKEAVVALQNFASAFQSDFQDESYISNGLFGHITYDSVSYFEDIKIQDKNIETAIPQMMYRVYRYVIAIDHFKDQMHIFEHAYASEGHEPKFIPDGLDTLEFYVKNPKRTLEAFSIDGEEQCNLDDEQMRAIIRKSIAHCKRGDVFQIVPSRRFSRPFQGDDFNVYRALRSINPSPYLFYFDNGDYHIFGSSPEKQIYINGQIAEIHPIAGTFRRSGDDTKDAELAAALRVDPKESAEHVMLVDLARNDLSRSSEVVKVEIFKEVQFYSHLLHLVSKVSGQMSPGTQSLQLVADTFPAGTLSGSPKYNAMTIINEMEPTNRSIYAGAIGFMDFKGNFNHAIAIRTFLSKKNTLFYQAGVGVVAKSDLESEMNEIHLKLTALRKALEMAQTL